MAVMQCSQPHLRLGYGRYMRLPSPIKDWAGATGVPVEHSTFANMAKFTENQSVLSVYLVMRSDK